MRNESVSLEKKFRDWGESQTEVSRKSRQSLTTHSLTYAQKRYHVPLIRGLGDQLEEKGRGGTSAAISLRAYLVINYDLFPCIPPVPSKV